MQCEHAPRSRADCDAFNRFHFRRLAAVRVATAGGVTPKVGTDPLTVYEAEYMRQVVRNRSASPRMVRHRSSVFRCRYMSPCAQLTQHPRPALTVDAAVRHTADAALPVMHASQPAALVHAVSPAHRCCVCHSTMPCHATLWSLRHACALCRALHMRVPHCTRCCRRDCRSAPGATIGRALLLHPARKPASTS
jgi:hypothetical protein